MDSNKRTLGIIFSVTILLIIAGCSTDNAAETSIAETTFEPIVCNQAMTNTGECSVGGEGLNLTLNSLEITDAIIGDDTAQFYPKKDYYFVIVDLTINNENYEWEYATTDNEKRRIYLYYDGLQLIDKEDYSYGPTDTYLEISNKIPPNIYVEKGGRIRGKVVYEIPISTDVSEFVFTGGSFGYDDFSALKLDISKLYAESKQQVKLNSKIPETQPIIIEPDVATKIGNVGDSLVIGLTEENIDEGFKITLNNVRFVSKIDETDNKYSVAEAPSGKEYVIVDITIENLMSKTYPFNPVFWGSKIADSEGYSYEVDWSGQAALEKRYLERDLPSNSKNRGEIAYLVPIDAKGLTFAYREALFNIN